MPLWPLPNITSSSSSSLPLPGVGYHPSPQFSVHRHRDDVDVPRHWIHPYFEASLFKMIASLNSKNHEYKGLFLLSLLLEKYSIWQSALSIKIFQPIFNVLVSWSLCAVYISMRCIYKDNTSSCLNHYEITAS